MWEPRRLTTLWASTACYRGSFTVYLFTKLVSSQTDKLMHPIPFHFHPTFFLWDRYASVCILFNYRTIWPIFSKFSANVVSLEVTQTFKFLTACITFLSVFCLCVAWCVSFEHGSYQLVFCEFLFPATDRLESTERYMEFAVYCC
jgi:hypothetical protein